ncbi:cupin domain-containing protein [Cupriavidus sp. amp6]|uniref:cupin domain-containing protein n=1 Tax=Cupriavidus sp. amp6 TaxID=388051 RepID=UPI0004202E16|nr:cupin domain-containing protein [Cupriavidus sp. amp6]
MPITIIRQSATVDGFAQQGTPARPLTQPPAQLSGIDVDLDGAGDNQAGLWECTPGRFERQIANAEVMHILAGACTFTPTHGQPQQVRAGDTLFFSANTTGEWHVTETLRKVFVVLSD